MRPDTVTVGTPFIVSVRLRAAAGAVVEFPAEPDTTGPVQALDPRVVIGSDDSLGVDQTARYRLAAWDVGNFTVPLDDIVVTVDGRTQRLAIQPTAVVVRTVLPADTTQWVPKPARGLIEFPSPWWIKWLIALAVLAIIGLLLWWWLRRRHGITAAADPYLDAEQRFARVESLGLLEAGERGRYVALMVDVLRGYLAHSVGGASTALTSSELVAAVRHEKAVPLDRLSMLLTESDLVKFARRQVAAEHALDLGRESRAVARHVHDQLTAPPAERAA